MMDAAPADAVTGIQLDGRDLERAGGTAYTLEVWQPDPQEANIAKLRATSDRWGEIASEYDQAADRSETTREVAQRAHFASLVAFLGAVKLAQKIDEREMMALAVHEREIVGVALYDLDQDGDRGVIAWVAVAPYFLAGAPVDPATQVRGIGTTLTCVVTDLLQHAGVRDVVLTPKDDAAEQFWTARGFHPSPSIPAGELTVARDEIPGIVAACEAQPDDQAEGHVCLCGTLEEIRADVERRLRAV